MLLHEIGDGGSAEHILHLILCLLEYAAQGTAYLTFAGGSGLQAALESDGPFDRFEDL